MFAVKEKGCPWASTHEGGTAIYAPGSPAPLGHWPSFWAWYPASHTGPHPAALLPNSQQVLPGGVTLPTTAGHTGAPVDHRAGKLPVLLYSPGVHGSRGQALHWFRTWQAAA
ncbi:hypothetical protein ACFY0R_17810 [Streptomyces sp. NPDC001633]|uniref:hypothetical protein n=1 Tax=Streptomyces sp. NPDC001633 TaxID=3364595 RepID=UPI0036837A45